MLNQSNPIAWLFPGQGSQEIGMGRSLFSIYPESNRIFELAEEYSGLPIRTVCQRGPESTLVQTDYLQPTLVALSVAFVDFLKSNGAKPMVVAGHSLGELSALYAAEVLDLQDVLKLATQRGRLMSQAASGGMLAIKDLTSDVIEKIIDENTSGVVVAANFNAPTQLVISGDNEALDQLIPRLSSMGGTCIRLNVQGAWHSPLVAKAADEFCGAIEQAQFHEPRCQLIMGMTAQLEDEPETIRALLKSQICSPVRWFDVVNKITSLGVTRFLEVGAGKVLKGLMRKIITDSDQYEITGTDNSRFLKELASNGGTI